MKHFHIMTLFPQMVSDVLSCSITGRAIAKDLIDVNAVLIRDFSVDKHGKTEDYPYGGGAGLVMQAQPIFDCYRYLAEKIRCRQLDDCREYAAAAFERFVKDGFCGGGAGAGIGAVRPPGIRKPRVLYMSPRGRRFDQQMAEELVLEEDLIFLCGHYEGVDERALELIGAEEVSIGDFILTGGELPACVMIDCISRLVPGVLGNSDSPEVESFHDNLLEYPQYSRPEEYMGLKVPEVLLSGHHANVDAWRRQESIRRTLAARPDLLEGAVLDRKERRFLKELQAEKS